ncbi:MAG: hypothetical protein IT372_32095 [Polyangiaceae bacterium]|nr:hypothetical protein [Polyangiaceae bacterium]
MRRLTSWLLALALGLGAAVSPAPALAAKATVEWKSVEAPAGSDHDRLVRMLKGLLSSAARKADFGKKTKSVALTARIVAFSSVTQGDVHRVSCTLVGRVVGGPTARSRISFGGRPEERAALEKQVLTMVANGMVGRLAEIVRRRTAQEEKAAKAAKEAAKEKEEREVE